MGDSSIWHWLVVLVVGVAFAIVAYPAARILKRMGFSRWWTLVAFIPYLNVAALWVLAFVRWPNDQRS